MPEQPIKRSISFVVRNSGGNILLVQRPPGDENLPNVWGLPAGSLKESEDWEDAVRRAGKEKLGVRLEPQSLIAEGTLERSSYTLHMKLFSVLIAPEENPRVPQPYPGVTQYTGLKWATRNEVIETLKQTAEKGSLCCMLYLASQKIIGEEFMRERGATLINPLE